MQIPDTVFLPLELVSRPFSSRPWSRPWFWAALLSVGGLIFFVLELTVAKIFLLPNLILAYSVATATILRWMTAEAHRENLAADLEESEAYAAELENMLLEKAPSHPSNQKPPQTPE